MARPTVQKNTLQEKGKLNILPQDQEFILAMLDDALSKCNVSGIMQLVPIIYRFGQKSPEDFDVSKIVDPNDIQAMSIHCGMNLMPSNPNTTMFWARTGFEDLVGPNACVFTCLSMHEAINLQTSLSHRPLDVSPVLQKMCVGPKINFLQLYVDSPHVHLKSTFRHPVSGNIVTCGLSHPNYHTAMNSRAEDYIGHMEDLARKLVCRFSLRIEHVVLYAPFQDFVRDFEVPLKADNQFRMGLVKELFRNHPVVIPFQKQVDKPSVNAILQECATDMVNTLERLNCANRGKGGFEASWKAFQLELALEELFYGHPLSYSDRALSASLGTSSIHEFSETHKRGFMALGPFNAAAVLESPPPLHHWTRDDLQSTRIQRVFHFTTRLTSLPIVIGPALLLVLVQDIYKRNERLPLKGMQGPECPGQLKGAQTLECLVDSLATRQSFPRPYTFARARQLVSQEGKDIKECLMLGFRVMKVKFFPDLKYRDLKGGQRATWNFADFVEVHKEGEDPSVLSKAASLVGDIAAEIERRGLSYARNLEVYREHGMPWLATVMERLPPNLPKAQNFTILVFLSCVGLLMNRAFVSYEKLKGLIVEMRITQAELQKLNILSSSFFPKVYGLTVWKLHYTVPYRLKVTVGLKTPGKEFNEDREPEEEPIPELEPQDMAPEAPQSKSVFMPANTSKHWTPFEMGMISLNDNVQPKRAYRDYVARCQDAKIPARSYKAFWAKRNALLE